MIEICCLNVLGGWQTAISKTGFLFGPIFNSCTDLWEWQRVHIYGGAPK